MPDIKTIAVDLTPVLPGGTNGGAKIFVVELVKQLASLAPRSRFVLLTQAASHDELAFLDGKNVSRLMVRGAAEAGARRPAMRRMADLVAKRLPQRLAHSIIYRVDRLLKRRSAGSLVASIGADLLFCPFTAPIYHDGRTPVVSTLYDLQYKTYPQFFSPADVIHRDRSFLEACKYASAMAAISEYSRKTALENGPLEAERIVTIPLRMAQRAAQVDPALAGDLKRRLGLEAGHYLMYPANFWRHKNHEMLLTAFGMACAQSMPPDVKLVCTGSADERQRQLAAAAAGLGLADRVVFPGFLTDAEFAALLDGCTAVVFPSLYEGFGLPVIEAMAVGKPVACSNLTSLPEVASDAALMFDPRVPTDIAQAMTRLVVDEALRERLVQVGKTRAAEFTDSRRMAEDYWRLFQHAVEHARDETLLEGLHGDGWAGSTLALHYAAGPCGRTLELEAFVPDWHPRESIVATIRGAKPRFKPVAVGRGARGQIVVPLSERGGRVEIAFSPSFRPADDGVSTDQRDLAVLVSRASLSSPDGRRRELAQGLAA
jgi:glycosyltransferase involved in cell wall biosynthesis